MKVITIPTNRDPYVVEINNQKYAFKAGTTVIVEDEVAEAVAHELALKPVHIESGLAQPSWGKEKALVAVTKDSEWREHDEGYSYRIVEMSKEEMETITRVYVTGDPDSEMSQGMYYDEALGGLCNRDEDFTVEYKTEGEVITMIPPAYHGLMIVHLKEDGDEAHFVGDTDNRVIADHMRSGGAVIALMISTEETWQCTDIRLIDRGRDVSIDGMTSQDGERWC